MGLPDKRLYPVGATGIFPAVGSKHANVVGQIHLKSLRVGEERGRNVTMSVECFIEVWSAAGFVRLLEGVFVVQTVLSVPGKT